MIDHLEIDVKAGDGGDGIIAFRREKFVPFGGPSGGNGGSGGDLILRASPEINDLRALRRRGLFRAGNGEDGGGKGKHGSKGKALVIDVPLGTVISSDGEPLVDLEQPGQQVVVAKGGKGGWGNAHYTTSTDQAPRIAQKGEA